MKWTSPSLTAVVGLASAWLAATSATAQPCNTDICSCLGSASSFTVVAGDIRAKPGRVRSFGFTDVYGTSMDGDVCTRRADLAGREDGEVAISGHLILETPAPTVAARFRGYRIDREPIPGTSVGGDLLTDSGTIKGADYVDVTGATDESGTRSELLLCRLAESRVAELSGGWAAAAGNSAGDIVVGPGRTYTLVARPGQTVFHFNSLVLRGGRDDDGDPVGATFEIEYNDEEVDPNDPNDPGDPNDPNDPNDIPFVVEPKSGPHPTAPADPPLIVINIQKALAVGIGGELAFGFGDVDNVVLNVYGERARIRVSKEAVVEPVIVSPFGTASLDVLSETGNLFVGRLKSQGGGVQNSLACP